MNEAKELDHEKIGEEYDFNGQGVFPFHSDSLYCDTVSSGERWIDLFVAKKEDMYHAIPGLGSYSSQGKGDGATRFLVKLRGIPFECPRSELCEFLKDAHAKENNIYFVSHEEF